MTAAAPRSRSPHDEAPVVAVLSYESVLPWNVESLRRAAARAGVALREVEPHRLHLRVEASAPAGAGVLVDGRRFEPDVVLHRTVQPYLAVVVPALEALRDRGTVVLNDPDAAAASRNKAHTLVRLARHGVPVPDTDVLADPPPAGWDAPDGEAVVKPALGSQGRDVLRAAGRDEVVALLSRPYAADDGPRLVQRRVVSPYDLRAYVVGAACVAVGQRFAAPGEWRCNAALGALVRPVADRGLARMAAGLAVRAVAALGLDHAAVDLLHDPDDGLLLVSEVDAWGGFAALEEGLGVDVAGPLLDLAVDRWRAAASPASPASRAAIRAPTAAL